MAECPTCGKVVATEAGMRQHHTKVHGNPRPNRQCTGCSSAFYDEKARRDFCDDCNPNAGKHNGNWRGGKETATCRRCEDEFEYYPSEKEGVYCPECVVAADEFLGTPYAEVHEIDRITRSCDYCGDEIEVLACNRRYGIGRFCSRECLSTWMSETRRGSNHHAWEGGTTPYFGNWCRARKKTLERDGHRCQICERGPDDLGQKPDVHHIEPLRTFEDPQEAHYLANLVALCRACHQRVESGDLTAPRPTTDDSQG